MQSERDLTLDEEVEDEEDKQMGQLGGDQPEELDRNMWAEEEEKENEKVWFQTWHILFL